MPGQNIGYTSNHRLHVFECPDKETVLSRMTLSIKLEMYDVESLITNEFVADNRPIFSESTDELLTYDLQIS